MNNRTAKEEYVDLGEIIAALIRRIGVILLTAAVFAAGGFLYSTFLATPLYSASAMMIVNSGEKYPDYVSTDQLNSAATLVDTYSIIIKSDTVMNEVVEHLGIEDTYARSVKSISVSSVDETQVMRIGVTATDPKLALDVCSEITNVAPDAIVEMVEAGSVRLVSKASTTFKPVSPNIPRNTVLAGMAGFLLAAALVVIRTLMDNKIKGEPDIAAMGLPILGVIPSYDMED